MTTEEIKLLLAATEKRIAELEPQKAELYARYKELEREIEQASRPMIRAREEWNMVYSELASLKTILAIYSPAELEQKGIIAA